MEAPTAVTCRSIIGKTDKGAGSIVWDSPGSNAGTTTTAKFGIKITSATTASIFGTVTSTYLFGENIAGTVSFASIAPKPGGSCENSVPIKFLHITGTSNFTL